MPGSSPGLSWPCISWQPPSLPETVRSVQIEVVFERTVSEGRERQAARGLRLLPGPVSLEHGAQGELNLCGLESGSAEELRGVSGGPGGVRKAEQRGWFLGHISILAGNRVGGTRQRPPALGWEVVRMPAGASPLDAVHPPPSDLDSSLVSLAGAPAQGSPALRPHALGWRRSPPPLPAWVGGGSPQAPSIGPLASATGPFSIPGPMWLPSQGPPVVHSMTCEQG